VVVIPRTKRGASRCARAAVAAWTVLGAAGCVGGAGSVEVTLWGEEFIPVAIPPRAGSAAGFENGWTLRYSKFLINVGAVAVAASNGAPGGTLAGYRVYDLHASVAPVSLGTIPGLAAQRYDGVSYRIAPATAASTAGNASAADLATMVAGGYAVYLEAEASHAMRGTFRLRWGFANPTRYETCHDRMDQLGVVVATGRTASAQITIHGDHPFYDDLQASTALVRFDAIADADADGDREVTLEELAAVDLTRLPTGQYGTGSAPGVNTLRDFVTSLVSTIGHFDGEGHCTEHRQ
jgi:hypothetical protein